jgi:hypothetical protein
MPHPLEKQLADLAMALGRGGEGAAALPAPAGLPAGAAATALERSEASAPDAQQVRMPTERRP